MWGKKHFSYWYLNLSNSTLNCTVYFTEKQNKDSPITVLPHNNGLKTTDINNLKLNGLFQMWNWPSRMFSKLEIQILALDIPQGSVLGPISPLRFAEKVYILVLF